MAIKRKKRTANKAVRLSPEALQQQADKALANNRFRDAINHLKGLLKQQDLPEHRERLATAYQGRARELAAKGMYKEAATIGENRHQMCPDALPDPQQALYLLHSGQTEQGIGYYARMQHSLPDKDLGILREHLAAAQLSGDIELQDKLPADDPILLHAIPAREALAAYCRNDDETTDRALAQIPFRSPYRDWAQVLKALRKMPQDPGQASKQLARIPETSPFFPLAKAVLLALAPEDAFFAELTKADKHTREFAASLSGWSEKRLTLWQALQKLGPQPRARVLFEFIHQHLSALGEAWVRQQGLRLLAMNYPENIDWLERTRLPLPSEYEEDLMWGWEIESRNPGPEHIFDSWMDVAQHLRQPTLPVPGSDNALRLALIQRRLDSQWHMLDEGSQGYSIKHLSLDVLLELEQSLELDPDDLATHIRLIGYYRDQRKLKEARRLVDQALKRWPEDVNALNEALDTAVTGGAFKKAAAFAHRVLQQDPINSRARNRLLDAHLAHARKQIRNGRPDLTSKELAAAREWVQGEQAECKLDMLEACVAYMGDEQSGAQLILNAIEKLGGGIDGRLALCLEAGVLHYSPGPLLKKLGLKKIRQPDKADLLSFLHRVREHLDQGDTLPPDIADYFTPALKAAARLDLSQAEYENTCEALCQCRLDPPRLAHAQAALKRWPGHPLFELHRFEAHHEGLYYNVNWQDLERLETAYEQAMESGDIRCQQRIAKVLDKISYSTRRPGTATSSIPPAPPGTGFPDFSDLMEDLPPPGEFSGMIQELLERLGPGLLEDLLDELTDNPSPEALLDLLDIAEGPPLPKSKSKSKSKSKQNPKNKPKPQDDGDDDTPDQQPDLFE